MKKLSWKPVRRGKTYCSPACGDGCTYAAYAKAKTESEKLARVLGPAWEPVVNENLGWHYSAVLKGRQASVHSSSFYARRYYANVYLGRHQFMGQASTPREAFADALALGKKDMVEMTASLVGIRLATEKSS